MLNIRRDVIRHFNNCARPGYPFAFSKPALEAKRIEHEIVSAMLNDLGTGSGKITLDAGCGPGSYTEMLLRHNYAVVAVDAAINMVKVSHLRYATDKQVTLLAGDIAHLPFSRPSFDLILCIDTLQYFDDTTRENIMLNFLSLLRPGGTIIVDVKNKWCPYFWFNKPLFEQFYSTSSIVNILKRRQFKTVKIKGCYGPRIIAPMVVVRAIFA